MAKTTAEMELDSYNRACDEAIYVEEISENEYLVTNIDHNSTYIVTTEDDAVISCTCPHHIYREVTCKHMVKVGIETGKTIL